MYFSIILPISFPKNLQTHRVRIPGEPTGSRLALFFVSSGFVFNSSWEIFFRELFFLFSCFVVVKKVFFSPDFFPLLHFFLEKRVSFAFS